MKILQALIIMITMLAASFCRADILIEDAKITDIRVGPWNTDSFAIKTTGTGDPCSGEWVIFLRQNLASDEAYDRAYTMALAAISAGKLVLVIGAGTDCAQADTIGFID